MTDKPRALVTGAARRLGRAMALDLAATGWDVAIHYHGSTEPAEETAAAARALGANAATLQADLLLEDQTGSMIARAAEALGGPLSLLINNASLFENDLLSTGTRHSWDRAIEMNLRAPVRLTQDFAAQAPQAKTDANGEPVAGACVITCSTSGSGSRPPISSPTHWQNPRSTASPAPPPRRWARMSVSTPSAPARR